MNQLMKAHEVEENEDQDEVSERRANTGHKSPDHRTRSKKSE